LNQHCKLRQIALGFVLALIVLQGVAFAAGDWILTDTGAKVWSDNPQPNETVTWTGSVNEEECASGNGVLQWFQDGSPGGKFEGTMQQGKPNGKGTYLFGFSSKFAGDRYEGDWVDGKKTGKGVYTWARGTRYEGAFLNDMMHGYGTYYASNGSVLYKGRWENNNFTGTK